MGKNLLLSFAYAFIIINRLIRCPSLHSDNLNTHLHFELPFSLQSLALQTTHSIANNSFSSPCPCCLPGSSLRASPWGAKFSREQNPSCKHSYAFGDLTPDNPPRASLCFLVSTQSCPCHTLPQLFFPCLRSGRFSSSSSSICPGPLFLSARRCVRASLFGQARLARWHLIFLPSCLQGSHLLPCIKPCSS